MADSVVLLKAAPEVRMLGDIALKDGRPDIPASSIHASFFDSYALEAAIRCKEKHGGSVVTATFGDAGIAEKIMRDALARGADRSIIVSDPALQAQYATGDSALAARILAAAIEKKVPGYELVFCGSQSEDAYAGAVGPMVAEYLGIPQLTFVDKLAIEKDTVTAERSREGGLERVTMPRGRMLVSVTNSLDTPRYASMQGIMRARSKPIEKYAPLDLGFTAPPSAAVQVSYAKPPARQDSCQVVGPGFTLEQLAERMRKVSGA